jgi:putative membrane protein insertion efficiency factor
MNSEQVHLSWIRQLAIQLIQIYQAGLAPMLGPACRFEPSCSAYSIEAISRYGVVRGIWLSLRRLARCNPLGGAGLDPLP